MNIFLHTDGQQHRKRCSILQKRKQLIPLLVKHVYIYSPPLTTRHAHTQYEPGLVVVRKNPLELLIENKDLLD